MNFLNLLLVVEVVVTTRVTIAEQFTFRPSSNDEDYTLLSTVTVIGPYFTTTPLWHPFDLARD